MIFDMTKESNTRILPRKCHISDYKNYIRPERGFKKNINEIKIKLQTFWITRNFL